MTNPSERLRHKLTRDEQERLYGTREKIDRIVKISHVLERLERCEQYVELQGHESVRNILQSAVFYFEESDIKEVIAFVLAKAKETKSRIESEIVALRPIVGLDDATY